MFHLIWYFKSCKLWYVYFFVEFSLIVLIVKNLSHILYKTFYCIMYIGCKNNIQNCHDYGHAVCVEPTYEYWVANNCALFCRTCGMWYLRVQLMWRFFRWIRLNHIVLIISYSFNLFQFGIDPTYNSWLTDKCASFCISIDKNRSLLLFLLFS